MANAVDVELCPTGGRQQIRGVDGQWLGGAPVTWAVSPAPLSCSSPGSELWFLELADSLKK